MRKSKETEKGEREKAREEWERGSLNLAFTYAWQTRNADDTGIVLSLVLSVRSRGSRILLGGRLLQHLSFACCRDEDIDLTPRCTRIACRKKGNRKRERERERARGDLPWARTSRCWNGILPLMDMVPANLISRVVTSLYSQSKELSSDSFNVGIFLPRETQQIQRLKIQVLDNSIDKDKTTSSVMHSTFRCLIKASRIKYIRPTRSFLHLHLCVRIPHTHAYIIMQYK